MLHSTFWFSGALVDEYGLKDVHISAESPWCLDIGAHIGSITLALALDNPAAKIIAVECVPSNVEVLRESVEHLALADRVFVVGEAAGAVGQSTATCHHGYYDVPGIPWEHAVQSRFIGNLFRDHGARGTSDEVPAVSLGVLLDRYGVEEVAFCKTDAEGAEWAFFADPAVKRIRYLVGEWHDRPASAVFDLFGATHEVIIDKGQDDCVGMFRAFRR